MVLTLLALVPLFIAVQHLWIYFGEGEDLRESGLRQARSQVPIMAKRGTIVDAKGRALVVNTPRYDVAVDPSYPEFELQQDSFLTRLTKLTGASRRVLQRKIDQRASVQFVRLIELTPSQRTEVYGWNVPGVILEERFRRRYNYGKTAAHVLGHVDVDGVGKAGLELEYNHHLQGVSGRRMLLRDRRGYRRVDAEGIVVPAKDGETLVLTIDLIRQTILEEELERGVRDSGARRGIAIAVDPRTGAILAMANAPSFDPNRPQDAPVYAWRNSAITDRLEPGSSFKLITATAAVDQGHMSMEHMIDTGDGTLEIYGRTMRDIKALGEIPFRDVITLSSNVGMAKTAQQMQAGDLYKYARNYGFGQKTWVDLPGEVSGLLKKTNRWSRTTLTSMAIGYEIDVTPIQLLMAYAALANGGLLLQPYVVAERRDVTGTVLWRAAYDPARRDSVRRVFSPTTAEKLMPAFIDVVERGTATSAKVEGMLVAGKTGTARKVVRGRYGPGYRATFVGFFPADDPKVAMIVVLDEPRTSIYGGAVSAPIFKRVAERWIGTLPDLEPPPPPPQPGPESEPHPAIKLWAERAWAELTKTLQPRPDSLRPHTLLLRDTPRSQQNARLVRATERSMPPEMMPDLRGLSARTARFWLTAHGFEVKQQGQGRVIAQSPEPGSPGQPTVTLQLE